MQRLFAIILIIPFLSACSAPPKAAERPPPPTLRAWDEYKPAPETGVWLGGQPSEQALGEFAARGGRLIINLRTDNEMDYLPYYADALAARGITYVRIPMRGSDLNESSAEALADAMARHPGPVMLHCASGGRATYLFAMRRIANEGLSADEAITWCEEQTGRPWEAGADALRDFAARNE